VAEKMLLHICCAPCSIYSWRYFQQKGFEIKGLFFNPNIQPFKEFAKRKKTLQSLAEAEQRDVIYEDDYPLEEFLSRVMKSSEERCAICYRWRLGKTAALARENGISFFSTTLLLSPYQKHDLLREMGDKVAGKFGLKFVYADLRGGFKESIDTAKNMGLYRQGYCGCIFSEKERYYPS